MSMMLSPITPLQVQVLISPLLGSLPAATVSTQPPSALLPFLSPILRQRVQVLSSTNSEPWLPLLCYSSGDVPKLQEVLKSERFEPHPVSGDVEIDWDGEVQVKYKRVDVETLQALVVLEDLGVSVKAIWCIGDELGGGDGWRISEVGVLDSAKPSWGDDSIGGAEVAFQTESRRLSTTHAGTNGTSSLPTLDEDQDDNDDYWAQYDNTPARTPAPKKSPALDDASYYAQYGAVQPALDNHDPDEEALPNMIESSLSGTELHPHISPEHQLPSAADPPHSQNYINGLQQPRPGSSTSSSGSDTVARLEREAASQNQSETAIRQHVSTSVKSLYRLARTAGIEREEFVRLVGRELECLQLMDEDD